MIKEVIVVEGRDDISAVKRAVDAEIIATGGFGFNDEVIKRIKQAALTRGIIILTDPDYAGNKIRQIISKKIGNCKHAFIPQKEAIKNGDIGVENASPEQIIKALNNAKAEIIDVREEFSQMDLISNNLIGSKNAAKRRNEIGQILGIGYCNSKQFIKRLNNYGITREEFKNSLLKVKEYYE